MAILINTRLEAGVLHAEKMVCKPLKRLNHERRPKHRAEARC